MLDPVVISGYDVCCSVGGLHSGGVFSVMWSKLLMTSISCPLWSSVCQRVEGAFTSLARTEWGMFVMYCMQWCVSVSAVLWCVVCAVLRRYIHVCNCDKFRVVNVYHDL